MTGTGICLGRIGPAGWVGRELYFRRIIDWDSRNANIRSSNINILLSEIIAIRENQSHPNVVVLWVHDVACLVARIV